jgi:hypothetical protein
MSVVSWLYNNNFNKPSENTPIPTHLSFEGGTFYIPEIEHKNFLYRYGQDLKNNIKLYLVESRPRIFKFMIDFDISDDHFWNSEEIILLGQLTTHIVHKYFDNTYVSVVCSSNRPKIKIVDGIEKIHSGIHIIFPRLFVNSETAQTLRKALLLEFNDTKEEEKEEEKGEDEISTLKKSLFEKTNLRIFDDIIDERIYIKNGYRMVGSDKIIKTKTLKNSENRVYLVHSVLNDKGKLLEELTRIIKTDYTQMMHYTAIRLVPDNIYYDTPNGIQLKKPEWFKEIVDPMYEKVQIHRTINSLESTIVDKINTYINSVELFGTDIVQDVIYAEDIDSYFIKVHSKYCMNIGKSHNSCGIYLVIYHSYLFQRCYCTCNTLKGRNCGFCCDYSSKPFNLPVEIFNMLYTPIKFIEDINDYRPETIIVPNDIDDVIQNIVRQAVNYKMEEKKEEKKEKKEEKKEKKEEKKEEKEYIFTTEIDMHKIIGDVCKKQKIPKKRTSTFSTVPVSSISKLIDSLGSRVLL